ncbi:hypothetical protein [Litoribacter populi]|uniref:hypothetical protein n=1 Tax=Litoribacter populi TaxID=2598460 RepID=UPI00117E107D|nr:hypothetical protein [Litoribacter populi]
MFKKIMIVALLFAGMCLGTEVKAQDYNTGIGLRAGNSAGVTIKHFLSNDVAFEGLIHSRWRGMMLTGLLEVHRNIPEARGLRWYYGAGAHVGFFNAADRRYRGWGDPDRSYTVVGIDGILGLEYTFVEIPLNLSFDWKPAFDVIGYQRLWADGFALSVRYVF